THQQGPDQRHILTGPAWILRKLGPHPRALIKTVVAPHVHDLIERPDLGRPVALELAVIVLADVARHGARGLDHVAERAGLYGLGAQFVDHDVSPKLPVADDFVRSVMTGLDPAIYDFLVSPLSGR